MTRRGRRSQRPTGGDKRRSQSRITFPPLELIDDEAVEAIHRASLSVLAETGMNFLLPEAVSLLEEAGAEVDEDRIRVRLPSELVEQAIQTVPPSFVLHGRVPEHHRVIGGDAIAFSTVGSTPNVSDIHRGRVTGNMADYQNLLRLSHQLDAVDMVAGYPVEPVDLDVTTRHLEAVSAIYTLTTKPGYGYALGRQRMIDAIEIARIARGIDEDQLLVEPSICTVVNANSPLVYDGPMLEGAIEMARRNQPVIYTPFTLAGAMAPVTIPGALVQQNAEALAGLVFSQIVNPGAPAVYGSFTSNVDMRSGSPAFGTPEYVKATIISGQLARRYNVPFRASNANASNAPDAQATYESQMSLWACVLGRVNFVLHGLGWIEGGLCTSYEKFIIDAEMINMLRATLEPVVVDEASLGLDAIREVGPAGHYFGAAHTLERYRSAFYEPLLSDWRNYETWFQDGANDATVRANKISTSLIEGYEQPPMDDGVKAELDDFVGRRIAEGGVPPL